MNKIDIKVPLIQSFQKNNIYQNFLKPKPVTIGITDIKVSLIQNFQDKISILLTLFDLYYKYTLNKL